MNENENGETLINKVLWLLWELIRKGFIIKKLFQQYPRVKTDILIKTVVTLQWYFNDTYKCNILHNVFNEDQVQEKSHWMQSLSDNLERLRRWLISIIFYQHLEVLTDVAGNSHLQIIHSFKKTKYEIESCWNANDNKKHNAKKGDVREESAPSLILSALLSVFWIASRSLFRNVDQWCAVCHLCTCSHNV